MSTGRCNITAQCNAKLTITYAIISLAHALNFRFTGTFFGGKHMNKIVRVAVATRNEYGRQKNTRIIGG